MSEGRVQSKDVTPEQARALLAEHQCPLCGRGPWRVVAGHVWRAHGVDGRALREMAGLPWSAKIADPEHRDLMAQLSRDNDRVANMKGKQIRGRANDISPAGRDALRRVGVAVARERRRKIPVEHYAGIVARLATGESAPSIAAEYGCTPQAVRFIAKKVTA